MLIVIEIGLIALAFLAGMYCNGHPAEVNEAGEAIKSRIAKLWDRIFHKEKS